MSIILEKISSRNANRLSSWQVGNIAGRAITYDGLNRRVRDDITHGAIPKPTLQRTAQNTFDAADKLVSANVRYGQGADSTPHITETFLYDNNGALTNWVSGTNTLSLSYSALGQLTAISTYSLLPTPSSFSYDALGNRIITGDKVWIPDHADPLKRPLMECDENGNIIRHYIWGGNRLLGFISSNNVLTLAHSDDFASIIALTDLSGNVIYSANYGPHGEDWGTTGTNPTPFTWLGGYGVMSLDNGTPLRLYLTRHRLYSATLNRFLSADPIGLTGGLNLYQYGEGNPLAYIDPLGLCSQGSSFWGDVGGFFSAFGDMMWQGTKDVFGFLFAGILPDDSIRASVVQTLAMVNMGAGMNVAPAYVNPFNAPASSRVFIVNPNGNVVPVQAGQMIYGSPNGSFLQVPAAGLRLDGPHLPSVPFNHAYVPGIGNHIPVP